MSSKINPYKYIISFLFCLLAHILAIGQQAPPLDVIILQDDGYLNGTVGEADDPAYSTVTLYDGTRITLPNALIKEIRKADTRKDYFAKGKSVKNEGYVGLVQLGVLNARSDYGDFFDTEWGGGFNTVHGYAFSKYLAVGLGTGMEAIGDYVFLPLYVNIKSYPFKKAYAPYASLSTGYGFSVFNSNDFEELKGGFMIHPAIGLRFPSRLGFNFFMELGIKFQKAGRSNFWSGGDDNITFRRTSFSLGCYF